MQDTASFLLGKQSLALLDQPEDVTSLEPSPESSAGVVKSSFNNVPVELCNIIFLYASIGDTIEDESINLGTLKPLQLTHVCSHWRKVCTENPHMWTTITYLVDGAHYKWIIKSRKVLGLLDMRDDRLRWYYNELYNKSLKGRRNLIQLYLTNSNDMQLNVKILPWDRFPDIFEDKDTQPLESTPFFFELDCHLVDEIVMPSNGRWITAQVSVKYYPGGFPSPLNQLNTLVLHGGDYYIFNHGGWTSDMINLRTVDFREGIHPMNTTMLPWNTITDVNIAVSNTTDFMTMACAGTSAIERITCRNVVTLSDAVLMDMEQNLEQSYFPHLTSLTFEYLHEYDAEIAALNSSSDNLDRLGDMTQILDWLKMPSLTVLRAASPNRQNAYWPHNSFLQMIERSRCDDLLHSLTLKYVSIADVELVECLQLFRNLLSLTLWDHKGYRSGHLITRHLIKSLTGSTSYMDQTTKYTPKLEFLELANWDYLDDSLLVDFLENRKDVLKEFSLLPKEELDAQVVEQLETIAKVHRVSFRISLRLQAATVRVSDLFHDP